MAGPDTKLSGQIVQFPERRMSAAVLTRSLQEREQARNGGSQDDARLRLARKLRVAPGTLYNLARDRLKKLDHALRDRIVQYAIRDIEEEIARLTHELELARQMGAAQNSQFVAKVETLKAQFEKLYAEIVRS